MTNEEILANAPGWATMVCMERFWQKLTANSWRSIRLDLTYESLRIMPSANSGGIRSLSDIRRIVELESELDKAYNDLANFEGYPEEVSALRHDIERRKQRYVNILHKKMEWKKRAEAAERERDYHVITIEVFRDWFTALRDHHVSNFAGPATKAFIGNLEVHLYWYTISDLLSGGGELDVTSNKFAIEQQIKALEELAEKSSRRDFFNNRYSQEYISTDVVKKKIEQLRQQLNGGE